MANVTQSEFVLREQEGKNLTGRKYHGLQCVISFNLYLTKFSQSECKNFFSFSERLMKLMDYYEGSFQDFTGHNDSVTVVKFSPDGKYLFSVAHSEILVWEVNV